MKKVVECHYIGFREEVLCPPEYFKIIRFQVVLKVLLSVPFF
jgi:hypothetical protein